MPLPKRMPVATAGAKAGAPQPCQPSVRAGAKAGCESQGKGWGQGKGEGRGKGRGKGKERRRAVPPSEIRNLVHSDEVGRLCVGGWDAWPKSLSLVVTCLPEDVVHSV